MATLLLTVLAVAVLNWLISVGRLVWRRAVTHKVLQQAWTVRRSSGTNPNRGRTNIR
jgi:hypothetical protein